MLLAVLLLASSTTSRATTPARVVPPGSAALCRDAVRALLGNELLQVATGRPDAGVSTRALVVTSNQDNPAFLARIEAAEQSLLTTATADLLQRYAMNVTAEVAAYGSRIVKACSPG